MDIEHGLTHGLTQGLTQGSLRMIMRVARRAAAALCLYLGLAASPVFACDIVTPSTANVGTFLPSGVPTTYVATTGSFKCPNGSILSLLAEDYLRATLQTTGTLTLTATTGGSLTYTLSATQDGTATITAGVTRSYIENTTVSLLSNSKAVVPIYIKPISAGTPPAGIYKGSFQIRWSWKFCNGIAVAGICLLADADQGNKIATVDVTMTVARNAVVTISQRATW